MSEGFSGAEGFTGRILISINYLTILRGNEFGLVRSLTGGVIFRSRACRGIYVTSLEDISSRLFALLLVSMIISFFLTF